MLIFDDDSVSHHEVVEDCFGLSEVCQWHFNGESVHFSSFVVKMTMKFRLSNCLVSLIIARKVKGNGLFELADLFVDSVFAALGAMFVELEFVRSLGFVTLGYVVEFAANAAFDTDRLAWAFFGF